MDYFRSSLKSLLGSSPVPNTQNGAEIIERLVDRVKNSLILEDRRDAARALKSLSRKYRIEVGAQGMDALIQILETDRMDNEIVSYALSALYNITCHESDSDHPDDNQTSEHQTEPEKRTAAENHIDDRKNEKLSEQFCEIFLKNPNNLQLVLNLLDEYDFDIRWPAVRLLSSLIENLPKIVQEIILISPTGVSKLIDLLYEKREIIRNEVVLLLIYLTITNTNIQKIVVFENAFDTLYDVIRLEDGLNGGIVVEDCLQLIYNLLKTNVSNQSFFKEGGFIQKFTNLLFEVHFHHAISEEGNDVSWRTQKIINFNLILKILRTLINPNNSMQNVNSCQIIMRNCSLLQKLCDLLMATGVPIDILTEILNTVADIIRGNLINQQIFSQVMAPSTPPRPVLNVLLMSMVNEKQPFLIRCSILYCFQCFLHKYENGQANIIDSFLRCQSEDTHEVTISQLLYGGMFSNDALSSWFSSIALAHCLIDNVVLKEKLLNVFLSTDLGSHPISILEQCTNHLQKSNKLQIKMGLLIFLTIWLSSSVPAVKAFLNTPNTMLFLIAQTAANEQFDDDELLQNMCAFLLGLCIKYNDDTIVQYSKENVYKIIEKRIGYDDYVKKLSNISAHELFSKSVKHPHVCLEKPSDLLLDYEFCKLYRTLEITLVRHKYSTDNVILKELKMKNDLANGLSEMTLTDEENGLLMQYKNLIREQDDKLRSLSVSLASFAEDKRVLQLKVEELEQTNVQLKDQNTYLKSLVSSYNSSPDNSLQNGYLNSDRDDNSNQKLLDYQEELTKLKKDHDDLLELLAEQDLELCRYRTTLSELGVDTDDMQGNFTIL